MIWLGRSAFAWSAGSCSIRQGGSMSSGMLDISHVNETGMDERCVGSKMYNE